MPIPETEVVLSLKGISPSGFINVFRTGDRWERIAGCEGCSYESRVKCCGGVENCAAFRAEGCYYNLNARKLLDKPLYCVLKPYPDAAMNYCQLIYRCVADNPPQGEISRVGLLRRVCDPGGVFREE